MTDEYDEITETEKFLDALSSTDSLIRKAVLQGATEAQTQEFDTIVTNCKVWAKEARKVLTANDPSTELTHKDESPK